MLQIGNENGLSLIRINAVNGSQIEKSQIIISEDHVKKIWDSTLNSVDRKLKPAIIYLFLC
jgi:hypothetical protein